MLNCEVPSTKWEGKQGKGGQKVGSSRWPVGKIGKNYTTLHNILQLKKGKEAENKKGWELG